jgi:hypothetical protein
MEVSPIRKSVRGKIMESNIESNFLKQFLKQNPELAKVYDPKKMPLSSSQSRPLEPKTSILSDNP